MLTEQSRPEDAFKTHSVVPTVLCLVTFQYFSHAVFQSKIIKLEL